MESFKLTGNEGIRVIFDRRQFTEDKWLESYFIKIEGIGVSAEAKVDNPPYGNSPLSLFDEMNVSWSGWEKNKTWDAMEGEFNLSASYGSGGHVQLAIEIDNQYLNWLTCAYIAIETGQLENIARQAKAFFIC